MGPKIQTLIRVTDVMLIHVYVRGKLFWSCVCVCVCKTGKPFVH